MRSEIHSRGAWVLRDRDEHRHRQHRVTADQPRFAHGIHTLSQPAAAHGRSLRRQRPCCPGRSPAARARGRGRRAYRGGSGAGGCGAASPLPNVLARPEELGRPGDMGVATTAER